MGIGSECHIVKETCVLKLVLATCGGNIVNNLRMEFIFIQRLEIRYSLQNDTTALQRGENLYSTDRIHWIGLVESHIYDPDFVSIRARLFDFLQIAVGKRRYWRH